MEDSVIKCKKGWKDLYEPIVKTILRYDSKQDCIEKKIGIESVEPSFGRMSFILGNSANVSSQLRIHMENAKDKSRCICECCGSNKEIGYIKFKTHISCYCKECADKSKEEDPTFIKWIKRKTLR